MSGPSPYMIQVEKLASLQKENAEMRILARDMEDVLNLISQISTTREMGRSFISKKELQGLLDMIVVKSREALQKREGGE